MKSIIKKSFVRVAFGLVFGFGLSFAASTGVCAADDYVDQVNKHIYANGHATIIEAGSESGTTIVKCDKNDNGTFETGETVSKGDLSNWSIFGGKKNGNVTNTKITMNSGVVDNIYAGGYAQGQDYRYADKIANVTGVAEITINGGKIKHISGGSSSSYGKTEVNKANIVVYTGDIGYIYANYGWAQDAFNLDGVSYSGDTNNVKEVSFKLLGGNIEGVNYTLDDNVTCEKVSSFVISGANIWGYASNVMPIPTSPDGTKLYQVELKHELNGELYSNKKIDYLQLADGTKYEYKDAYTSNYEARIHAWLPENSVVKWSTDGTNKFVYKDYGGEIKANSNYIDVGTVTNVVKKPQIESQITYSPGYREYGFTHLYSGEVLPYTISGDEPRQNNAGNYKTTFDLPAGLKWDDGTTGKYVVNWKIDKCTRNIIENDYHKYNEYTYKGNDGKIYGLKANQRYEYSTDNLNWTDVPEGSTEIKNLAPGTYYLRIKEDTNFKASATVTLTIEAAPKPTRKLTICKFGSNDVLCEVTAPMLNSNSYEAVIPEEYFDYAFFTNSYSVDPSYQIVPDYDSALGIDTIIIKNNTTIYALEPTYINKSSKFILTDNKQVSVVMGKTSNDLFDKLDDDLYNKYYFTNYFDMVLQYKLQNNEFGDISGFNKEEKDSLYCSNTYYVIPCKYSDSRLTNSDCWVAKNYYKNATVIPHISLEEESGAVMKINVKLNTENGKSVFEYIYSSVDDAYISSSVILDLGKYPKLHDNFVIYDSPARNIVINSSKFNVTYGQSEVPTPAPTATTEPTATPDLGATTVPTQLPSGNPDITPTAAPSSDPGVTPTSVPTSDPSAQPVPTNEPQVSDVPVKTVEKVILDSNTDKADVAGSTQRFLFLRTAAVKKNSIKIKWNKVSGADGYMIYGSKCGSKMKFIKDIKKPNATSCTFKKLKKNTYYKYMVVAYKNTDSEPMVITTSKSVHAATSGGKKGNPIAIKKVKKNYTIKKGKTLKLKPAFTSKKKVSLHIAKFRYESLDESVATVSKKGKIKAVGKGETTILVYTQNGICKKVKLVVK